MTAAYEPGSVALDGFLPTTQLTGPDLSCDDVLAIRFAGANYRNKLLMRRHSRPFAIQAVLTDSCGVPPVCVDVVSRGGIDPVMIDPWARSAGPAKVMQSNGAGIHCEP
jgi:hypothetical protein